MSKTPYLHVDVIVAGGGPSGVAAATVAARLGASTLIIERYGRLGGAGVTSLVNPLMGYSTHPIVAEIHERFAGYGENWEMLDIAYADMAEAAGVKIMMHAWVFDTIVEEGRVKGVRVLTKEGILELIAGIVVDATADGDVALHAGAEFEKGRAGDQQLQPMTIMFRIGGVDKTRAFLAGSEEAARDIAIGDSNWADITHAGMDRGELPPNVGVIRTYESSMPGERVINATQINAVDGTKVLDLTRAELEGRRQAPVITAFLRKYGPGYENCYICNMPAVIGVRETRRFIGVEYLSKEDLLTNRRWETAIVANVSFPIDIHNPAGAGQAHGSGVAEQVRGTYDIPYGCIVPKTIDGLVLSGRCISGSHEAHASYRVQNIVASIGAASGAAAAVAALSKRQPRDVPASEVRAAIIKVCGSLGN